MPVSVCTQHTASDGSLLRRSRQSTTSLSAPPVATKPVTLTSIESTGSLPCHAICGVIALQGGAGGMRAAATLPKRAKNNARTPARTFVIREPVHGGRRTNMRRSLSRAVGSASQAAVGKLLYAMAPFIISERELAAVTDAMAAVVDAVEREAL